MKKVYPILIFAMPLILVSCYLSSESPVPQSGSIDTSVYTGRWNCVRFGGETSSTQLQLTVSNATNGNLVLMLAQGAESHSQSAILGSAGSKVIASVQGSSGKWELLSVDLLSNGTRLVVGVLDATVVKQDIQSGVVTGEVTQIETNTSLITLKAAGTNLTQYLSTHTNAFTEGFIFDKTQ